jgi:hypothetical protein
MNPRYIEYRPHQTIKEESPMTTQITIKDLIETMRKAAANPKAHAHAQGSYFSRLRSDSVLINCGSACCVAGDLMLKAHHGYSREYINDILGYCGSVNPGDWVASELGLSDAEENLAFSSYTHHEIHSLLADLLEAGLRLSHPGKLEICGTADYLNFNSAYLEEDGEEGESMNLEELKKWMIAIAR